MKLQTQNLKLVIETTGYDQITLKEMYLDDIVTGELKIGIADFYSYIKEWADEIREQS